MPLLEISGLTKRYGSTTAVDHLTLAVERGSVFGFLGLNGAGKTTTIRMITGLAHPSAGAISVCGERVQFGTSGAGRHIGYLPDVPEFYGFMRPAEYLSLCGRLSGLDGRETKKRSAELLRAVGLESVKRRIGGFSRGMKQRLGIAQALIHTPELLILDEPTSALDPVGRREILDIIASLRGKVTVLFSTHILSDVQRVCDTVGILQRGRLVLQGDLREIESKYAGGKIRVETTQSEKLPELAKRLRALRGIRDIKEEAPGRFLLSSDDSGGFFSAVCPLFAELGLPLLKLEQVEPDLENVFFDVINA